MEEIECIHRGRDKKGKFFKWMAEDPYWRKVTGWEILLIPHKVEMPETVAPSLPDELHAKPVKRRGGRPRKAKPTPA